MAILFNGCDKAVEFPLTGSSPDDGFTLQTKDTFALQMTTEKYDSVATGNLEKDLLGSYHDNEFGATKASVYTQLFLAKTNQKIGNISKIDSVVLVIRNSSKADYYGNKSSNQLINIYELEADLPFSTSYYSNSNVKYKSTPISNGNISLNADDTVTRFKIDTSFGGRVLRAGDANMKDNTVFIKYLKGIAIVPAAFSNVGEGGIIGLSLSNVNTKLRIYYNDTMSLDLVIGTNNIRFNKYEHDYTGSNLGSQFGDTSSKLSYLHSMAGSRVHLTLPDMKSFATGGHYAIHMAEFIFPKSTTSSGLYSSPVYLVLRGRDAKGQNVLIEDEKYSLGGKIYYDGAYSGSDNYYHFYLTRHMQYLIDQYSKNPNFSDLGLNLFLPSNKPLDIQPVILTTQKNTTEKKPRIILTYSNVLTK